MAAPLDVRLAPVYVIVVLAWVLWIVWQVSPYYSMGWFSHCAVAVELARRANPRAFICPGRDRGVR